MKKNMEKWNMTVRAINLLVGTMLGLSLVYIIKEELNVSVLLGAFAAAVILIVFNVIKVRLKSDKIPDTDERTQKNMLSFHLYSAHVFIGLLFIALSISSFIGIEKISTITLWILIVAYMCVSGIGAFIVSRR